jgi:hypothetical protein
LEIKPRSQFTVWLLGTMCAFKLWTTILWIFLCRPSFRVLLTVNLMCQGTVFVIFYQITMWLGWWSSSHNSQLLLKCFYHNQFNIPLQNATFHKLFLWKFSPFYNSCTRAILLITFLKNLLMHTSIQITFFMWQYYRLGMNVKQKQDHKCTKPCSIIMWSSHNSKRMVNMQSENFFDTHTTRCRGDSVNFKTNNYVGISGK